MVEARKLPPKSILAEKWQSDMQVREYKELFSQILQTSDRPPRDVSSESTSSAPLGRAKTENHFTVHCERGLAISFRAYSTIGRASFTTSLM